MDITYTVYTTDITAIRECFGEKAYCLKIFIGMTHRYVCASFRYSLRLMLRYPVCMCVLSQDGGVRKCARHHRKRHGCCQTYIRDWLRVWHPAGFPLIERAVL